MRAGIDHRIRMTGMCALLAVFLAWGACVVVPPTSDGIIWGKVVAATPVEGAHVSAWQMTPEGEKYELLAEDVTDDTGQFSFHVGQAAMGILIEATGGHTVEPWAPDVRIPLEFDMRAVLTDYLPGAPGTVRIVTVSPLTTMATALAESRLARGDKEDDYKEGMRRAYELLGGHLGDIHLTDTPVVRPSIPADELRDGVRYGLILAGLSGLAQWIAQESGSAATVSNTLALTRLLVEDASDERALFDGMGPDGPLRVVLCSPPPECQDDPGSCEPPVCDLDANTLRADLATGLAFYFLPSEHNGTGLTLEELRVMIEDIWTRVEPELFGVAPIGELGGELPAALVGLSQVDDEWTDAITFSPAAVPSFRRTGPVTVLDGPGACEAQVVRKYVARMDDRDDNPVRWVFSVIDQRGVGIDPDGGAYRVGLRGPDGVDWLTEWRAATRIETPRTDGADYEVVLLRSELPELATRRGIFEIEFRGRDRYQHPTPVVRSCWEHVPLAAPLWVGPAADVPASDPRSLYGVALGDGLAPLLNGVPLAEGKGIMAFEIRNGTTEPVYVTLAVEQPAASFSKSWQKTNVMLHSNPPSGCLRTGDCSLGFPADRRTTVVVDETGSIPSLIQGIQIIDTLTGDILAPCENCQPDQYKLEPRIEAGSPRVYRVMPVVLDLGAMAPQPLGEDYGPFADTPIDPVYLPTRITGRAYGQVRKCEWPGAAQGDCDIENVYAHYLALQAVTISINWLRVNGRVSPAANMPAIIPGSQPNTFGQPLEWQPTPWTQSQALPAPEPPPLVGN